MDDNENAGKLAQESFLEDLEAIANYWDGVEVKVYRGGEVDVGKDLRERFAAIAADRASRQVANKAEVEPVAHLKFWARQSWSGNGNHDVENAEGLEVCEAGEIGDDGEPAFPVYATPPATTGASTDKYPDYQVCTHTEGKWTSCTQAQYDRALPDLRRRIFP